MAGALQIGRDIVGVAKQTALGAIAANPTYAHGVATGSLPQVAIGQADDPQTSGGRAAPGAYRNSVDEKFVFDTRAWQKSIGLYLLAALGNDSVTGSGPYTHTIAQGLTVPYLSMFAKKGDGTFIAVRDSKITKLELSWADNQPLVVSVETDGTVLSFPATFTPSGADESGTLAYYTPVGGTFKYDITTSTPAVASVVGGKVTILQDVTTPIFSGAIEAGDAIEGNLNVDVSLDVIPTDATLWRKILTGSVSGTSIMTTPQYGSFDVKFAKGADSLDIAASNVGFLADLPGADAKGGPGQMSIAGGCYPAAAGGTPLTAVLINTVPSY
jgi:hypothetical protein